LINAAALLMLLGQQVVAEPRVAGGSHCLPDQSGFLTMRVRGSIEAEIRWREPQLDCTGMPRPDGRGLRLRFAGPLSGNSALTIVFAAPELGMGVSTRRVPVNVTLIDESAGRIYGTQGESRCMLDSVEQRPLSDEALPPLTFRVSARGFCTVPARALDGNGAVLLTRFDFAGRVTFQEHDESLPDLPQYKK
jgi:hypothetical protein